MAGEMSFPEIPQIVQSVIQFFGEKVSQVLQVLSNPAWNGVAGISGTVTVYLALRKPQPNPTYVYYPVPVYINPYMNYAERSRFFIPGTAIPIPIVPDSGCVVANYAPV